jgi:hypothetical protein
MLDDEGQWWPIWKEAALKAGIHYSPQSLTVLGPPKGGWLIGGKPEAVDKACKTRRFGKVTVLRLTAAGRLGNGSNQRAG